MSQRKEHKEPETSRSKYSIFSSGEYKIELAQLPPLPNLPPPPPPITAELTPLPMVSEPSMMRSESREVKETKADALINEIRSRAERHSEPAGKRGNWRRTFDDLFSRCGMLRKMIDPKSSDGNTVDIANSVLYLITAAHADMQDAGMKATDAINFNRRIFEYLLGEHRAKRIKLNPAVINIYKFYIDSYRLALGRGWSEAHSAFFANQVVNLIARDNLEGSYTQFKQEPEDKLIDLTLDGQLNVSGDAGFNALNRRLIDIIGSHREGPRFAGAPAFSDDFLVFLASKGYVIDSMEPPKLNRP